MLQVLQDLEKLAQHQGSHPPGSLKQQRAQVALAEAMLSNHNQLALVFGTTTHIELGLDGDPSGNTQEQSIFAGEDVTTHGRIFNG